MSDAQLRQMLIDEVKRQNKPYGLYFRDITGGFTTTARAGLQAFKVIPVIVYRVYPDGRPDELVRGADIVGTPLASFSKILATGDKPEVFNGYCGAESGSVPVSAVSPAILVSEIEIEKKAKSNDRPPLLPEPTIHGKPGSREMKRAAAGSRLPLPRSVASAIAWSQAARRATILLRAMHDEIERARAVSLPNLEKPYFIQYQMDEADNFSVSASLGGLLTRTHTTASACPKCRSAWATTSSTTPTMPAASAAGSRYDLGRFPLDDSYAVLRRYFWLETDSAYKARRGGHLPQARGPAQPDPERPARRFRARRARCITSRRSASLSIDEEGLDASASAIFRRSSRSIPDVKDSERRTGIGRWAAITW